MSCVLVILAFYLKIELTLLSVVAYACAVSPEPDELPVARVVVR
jgi:hypothetical protein